MSKSTTGRQLLDELEARVAVLEGGGKPDPMESMQDELKKVHRRLKRLEEKLSDSQGNNQPAVENG